MVRSIASRLALLEVDTYIAVTFRYVAMIPLFSLQALSAYAKQLAAFMVLVVVQATAILLFKLCQRDGKYTFSPASSVALTELCKLALALALHYQHISSSKRPFWEGMSIRIAVHYFGLSLLYTINNQLSFYCLEIADPGSMALGKSIAPYLCALLLRLHGQVLQALQWVCIVVQCCAIAIVQYDACKGTGYLPDRAYYLIALATSITAVTSVWNQLIIKGFEVPVNLQNSIMYAFGSGISILSYLSAAIDSGPLGTHQHHVKDHSAQHAGVRRLTNPAIQVGFFEGYTPLAILLVVFQAFHGLAVALVYKYADAIVKNFANSSVMAILIVVSFIYFHLQTTLHSWLGIVIVLATTYCYMNIALRLPSLSSDSSPLQEKTRLLGKGSEGTDTEEGSSFALATGQCGDR